MEKISSKMKTSYQKLQKIVQQFIGTFSAAKIQLKHKSLINFIQKTQLSFIKQIIVFVCCKQLSIIDKVNQQREILLLKSLRDNYYRMSVEVWKKQILFEMWIVFITKIVSNFYTQAFIEFTHSIKLQSEIYIILVHSFIGLNVNQKSYQLLNSKYLHQNTQNQVVKIKGKTQSAKKNKLKKILSKSTTSFYRKSRNASDSNNTLLNQLQSEQYQQLRSFLKKSLYCANFPKIKASKKSSQMTFHNQSHQNQSVNFNKTDYQSLMRKKTINSTQNSVSFENQILTHNINLLNNKTNKNFKIPHRIQFKSNYKPMAKQETFHQITYHKKIKHQKQNINKSTNHVQWLRNMKKMKNLDGDQSAKFDISSLFITRDNREDRKQQQQHKKQQFQMFSKVKNRQKQYNDYLIKSRNETSKEQHKQEIQEQSRVLKLDYFTKNFKQIPISSMNYLQKTNKQKQLKSRELRAKKQQFQINNQQRNKKIQYSIFQLPQAKGKIFKLV